MKLLPRSELNSKLRKNNRHREGRTRTSDISEPVEISGPEKVCLVWVDVKGKNKAQEEGETKTKYNPTKLYGITSQKTVILNH
jgi:hypothetical protein